MSSRRCKKTLRSTEPWVCLRRGCLRKDCRILYQIHMIVDVFTSGAPRDTRVSVAPCMRLGGCCGWLSGRSSGEAVIAPHFQLILAGHRVLAVSVAVCSRAFADACLQEVLRTVCRRMSRTPYKRAGRAIWVCVSFVEVGRSLVGEICLRDRDGRAGSRWRRRVLKDASIIGGWWRDRLRIVDQRFSHDGRMVSPTSFLRRRQMERIMV
jgi:hypothetical protein